ncbi:MAG TPA: hypothetical protein VJ861_10075, partial [Treponemataceae bacterium]|nr:hypothetical protein [Treponemataceae bacterium]
LQPFFNKKMYLPLGSDSEYGFSARGFWYPVINVIKTQATGYFRIGITEDIMFAAKGSLGASPFVLSAPISFDLYYTEDRAVRSGYLREELEFSNFGFASAEFRYNFFSYRIPPLFDVNTHVFAFTDLATNMDVGRDFEFLDAFGVGFRILFQNPIFAYFTISYGINNLGDGRFFFCGTAGY